MLQNTSKTYSSIAKFFHWIIALLLIIMLFLGYLMTDNLINIHKITGLTILILATCRLIWTLTQTHPPLPNAMPFWEKLIARITQTSLYICMFGMPLSGWAMATIEKYPPHIGHVFLPMPGISYSDKLDNFLDSAHSTLAIILIVLICLHILGALKHYFIDKDNVLKSMWP